ncbi:MAG: hypothetical protein JNL08_14675 [Planctomycetes bacterium]|nr:hypothetical protein [Planctomycetota bacterium]
MRSGPFVLALSVATASLWPVPPAAAPSAAHADVFTTSEQCAVCHSAAPGATAMRSPLGDDISPYGLWQGTMMANSFRDPYFRAQLEKETAAAGAAVQELCLRCHAPMASHGAVLAGGAAPRLADVDGDLAADDGVSCTVCHAIAADGLGDLASFSGQPQFDRKRRLFGPFADVAVRPMQGQVNYTPTHGPHVQRAALCGSCHTLITEHQGVAFAEQTPYLEWRNSEFSDEAGASPTARTCQQCHMADVGPARIARTPMGVDYTIPARDGYRAHAFVGGNAFVLSLLQSHRDELDVTAEPEAIDRMIQATRRQLAEQTARLEIGAIERDGGAAAFAIRVENRTGHKFPTGYPARRAWLHIAVTQGDSLVFESGAFDRDGRLVGVDDPQRVPHVATVTSERDVVVYELVAADPAGVPTTHLTRMVQRQKDNRLLPRGFRSDGPHVTDTAPVGTDGDADFTGGSDTVACRVPLPEGGRGRIVVQATLYYQPVPPHWVDALREVDGDATRRFVAMYDAADKEPDVVATAVRAAR